MTPSCGVLKKSKQEYFKMKIDSFSSHLTGNITVQCSFSSVPKIFYPSRSMTETLFNVEKIRLHPQVSALEQISTPDGQTVVGFYSYNFYHKAARDSDIKLTFLWKPGMEIKNAESLFTEMKDFQVRKSIICPICSQLSLFASFWWNKSTVGNWYPGGNYFFEIFIFCETKIY